MQHQNLKIALLASEKEETQQAYHLLKKMYDCVPPIQADCLVALGGDGFMLHTLHQAIGLGKPVFGMNFGTLGFLMNDFKSENLLMRIQKSHAAKIFPLQMKAFKCDGSVKEHFAFNEVSLLREKHQAAKIRILVDERARLDHLVCDGILVSTPAGSTAYNFSASGPILPINSNLLAVTPISPFRPRRWRGALLPNDVTIAFEVLETGKRPVSATADYQEVRDICRLLIKQAQDQSVTLLFDSEQTLAERIIAEQFAV